jgi:hypothetical protein
MDGRCRYSGFYALSIGVAAVGLWSAAIACETAVAAEATKVDPQITAIPGNESSSGHATIDYRNASPLPLPSATWPRSDSPTPVEPRPNKSGGTSFPGGHGSGEQHMKIIPPQ